MTENMGDSFLQLHSKLLETERQLGEAHGRLKEQRQLSSEKLMDREQQVADLQLKLSRAEEQVGVLCRFYSLFWWYVCTHICGDTAVYKVCVHGTLFWLILSKTYSKMI